MQSKTFLQILFFLIFVVAFNVQTTTAFETAGIDVMVADDAGAYDEYGFSIDTDGRWLVVGAKYAAQEEDDIGAVYVYKRHQNPDRWEYVQKIVPVNGIHEGEFGESVAVSRNSILIGARSMLASNGRQSGLAYLYKYRGHKSGWVLEATVEPSNGLKCDGLECDGLECDGYDGDEFGRSVALGPNRLIVGARFAHNDAGEKSGAVYVYQRGRAGWQLQKKIIDPEGGADDQFGRAISYDSSKQGYLAVGSRNGKSDAANDFGKVLVFESERQDWRLSQVIIPEDGVDGDYFGQSVVLSKKLMVVGARNATGQGGEGTGAAYVYRRHSAKDDWFLEQKLSAPEGKKKAQYGFAVDVDRRSSTTLAVSARKADSDVGNSPEQVSTGQVYLYSYDPTEQLWSLDEIIAPGSLEEGDEFGQCLALDPKRAAWLAIGADQSAYSGQESGGAVYILNNKVSEKRPKALPGCL